LREIKHKSVEGSEDFALEFHFAPNEFFENDVLTAHFKMLSDNDVDKIVGTTIKWKDGKDLTKKTIEKK